MAKINQTPILTIYKTLYNEMVDTLRSYVYKNSEDDNGIDLELVFRWYEDEGVNAIKISRIYVKDKQLYVVYNNLDFDLAGSFGAIDADFDTDIWDEREQVRFLYNLDTIMEGHWVSKFDIEVMDEIIAYLERK